MIIPLGDDDIEGAASTILYFYIINNIFSRYLLVLHSKNNLRFCAIHFFKHLLYYIYLTFNIFFQIKFKRESSAMAIL